MSLLAWDRASTSVQFERRSPEARERVAALLRNEITDIERQINKP
jgi:hypothetical protein